MGNKCTFLNETYARLSHILCEAVVLVHLWTIILHFTHGLIIISWNISTR